MPLKGLYAITDNHLTPSHQLLGAVKQALEGGTRILQYRDKSQDTQQRLQEALALKNLCRQYDCTFIINDDIDLCKKVDADGVHLGMDDKSIAYARKRLGPRAIIGATCHGSLELAYQAKADSANYVAFGRFYSSRTKPNAIAADLDIISAGLAPLGIPTVAIGGITLDKSAELLKAGFSMLAVVEDIFKPSKIAGQTITTRCEAYCDAFNNLDN